MMAAVVKDDLSPRLAKLETAIKGDYIFGDVSFFVSTFESENVCTIT